LVGEQTYRGVIDVVSSGGAAEVQVELATQTPEKTVVSPAMLNYGTIGAQPPPLQTVRVTNAGGGTLQGTVTPNTPWIQVSSTVIAGNALELSVSLKPDEMPAGQALAGRIELVTNGGAVTIHVQASALPAAIALGTPSLDFGTVPPRGMRRLVVRVANGGTGRLEGQVTSTLDWVRIDKTRWSGNVLDLAVELDGRKLADGLARTGVIHLASNGGAVDLAVRAVPLGPTLAVEPSSLDLRVRSGSRARRHLRLTNLGTGALSGSARSTVPWLRLKPEQFSGATISLEASIAAQGLAPGTHTGFIVIDSNGGPSQVGVQVQVVPYNPWMPLVWALLGIGLLGMLVLATSLIWWGVRHTPAPAVATVAPPPPPVQPTVAPAALTLPTSTSVPVVIALLPTEAATLTPVPVVSTLTPSATAQPTRTPTRRATPTDTSTTALGPLCPNLFAQITSPSRGAALRGTIQIRGTADSDRLAYYKLELRPEGDQTWGFLARFDQPVTEGVLMKWDTTTVSPGAYRLRLVVVDETGNYPEPCEMRVIVNR
jgi:hypothetical protein